jgi:hypothetical protein
MLRFLLDKCRTIPGPFQQARVVTADLVEELLALGRHYLDPRRNEASAPDIRPPRPVSSPPPAPPEPKPTVEVPTPAPAARAADASRPRKKKAGKPTGAELEVPAALALAMEAQGNLRKQDFKILAILWDAENRGLGPLSAKGISQHGGRIGIPIRHENVRKVIRSRLERHVTIHTEVIGTGTVYRYEMNAAGKAEFEDAFLGEGR